MDSFEQKITPILLELEGAFLEQSIMYDNGLKTEPPQYSIEALRASLYVFMSVMIARTYEYNRPNTDFRSMCNMADEIGKSLKDLVGYYTGIDTFNMSGDE